MGIIRAITIINSQGTKCYSLGNTYNEMVLVSIEDKSIEYPNALVNIYIGKSKDGDKMFEIINAPVEVEFAKPNKNHL